MRHWFRFASSLLVLLAAFGFPMLARAGWLPNGNPICIAPGTQDQVALAAGSGGFIAVAWRDNRNDPTDPFDIYGQAIDSSGGLLWSSATGLPICVAPTAQVEPAVSVGPDGLVWVGWMDTRSCAKPQIFSQGFDQFGSPVCTPNGIAVIGCDGHSSDGGSHHPSILSVSAGSSIASWNYRPPIGFGYRGSYIQAQKVSSASCGLAWGSSGTNVYAANWTQDADLFPTMVPDGTGGVIAVFADDVNGSVLARRIDSGGTALWGVSVQVCTDGVTQRAPSAASDGSGGVIVVWEQGPDAARSIRGQRIDSGGVRQWGNCGKLIASRTPGDLRKPQIVRSSLGKSFVAWQDASSLNNSDIYVQRIDFLGDTLGMRVPICTAPYDQTQPRVAAGDNGSCFIVWQDARDLGIGDDADVYAQKLDANGDVLCPGNGMPVCTLDGSRQYDPRIVSNGEGSVVIAWTDTRNGNPDVYAQMLGGNCLVSAVADESPSTPRQFSLGASYPNPFRLTTKIGFSLADPASEVDLRVFDICGRLVRVLVSSQPMTSGNHNAVWDGRTDSGGQAAPGIYFYTLNVMHHSVARRTVLLR